ncbi:unnamed protein product [Allacma fusca]|uniref:Uncharacterized protein n=1 Tax=Allacma fusca TaxID=39272 RepID=A0A8J2JCV6_9HEXA|nr:unnamed protein product [Allacma fusca]
MFHHLKKLLELTTLIRIHTQTLILTTAFLNICPTTLAGLAIDQYMQTYYEQAQVGDPCDYYAFMAFRVPILKIIVRTHGNLKDQNLAIARYESFVYKNASNITTLYDYVPTESQDLICRSRRIPLMCQLKNPSTGAGVCVCLELNVTDKEGDMGVVRVVRTSLAKSIEGENWNDSLVHRSMDANQTRNYVRLQRKPVPYMSPTGSLTTACALAVCETNLLVIMSRSRNKVGNESTSVTRSSEEEEDSDSFDINDDHMTSSIFLRGNIRLGQENALKLNRNRELITPHQPGTSASACNTESTGLSPASTFNINNSLMTSSMFTRGNIRLRKENEGKFNRKLVLPGSQLQQKELSGLSTINISGSTEASSTFDVNNDIQVTSSMFNKANEKIARNRPYLPRPNREETAVVKKSNNSLSTTSKHSDFQDSQKTCGMLERVNKIRGSSRQFTAVLTRSIVKSLQNEAGSEEQNLILGSVPAVETIADSVRSTDIGPGCQDHVAEVVTASIGNSHCERSIIIESEQQEGISESMPESLAVSDCLSSSNIRQKRQERISKVITTPTNPYSLRSSSIRPELQELVSKVITTSTLGSSSSNDYLVTVGTDAATKTTGPGLPSELLPDVFENTANCTYFNYESGSVSSALKKCGIKLPPYPENTKKKSPLRKKSEFPAPALSAELLVGVGSEVPSGIQTPSVKHQTQNIYSDPAESVSTHSVSTCSVASTQLMKDISPEIEVGKSTANRDPPKVSELYLPEVLGMVSRNFSDASTSNPNCTPGAGVDNFNLFPTTPKKNRRNSNVDYQKNDNLISKQVLLQMLEEFEISINRNQVRELHNFLNFQLETVLNKLCSANRGCQGVFTYRQLETALKKLKLVDPSLGNCSLLISIAHILTPSQYKRAKGIVIPFEGEHDTKLNSILKPIVH